MAFRGNKAPGLSRNRHQTPIVALNHIGMNRLVSQVHEERTIRRCVHEPFHIVSEQVGRVTLGVYTFAIDIQRGIDGFPLSWHSDPVVESGARAVVASHVPLAEEPRPIAGALKFQWEHPEAVAWSSGVVDDAVSVRVLACQEACPARRAERRRGECVREAHPFARESVHVRRIDERMAGDSHLIPAHVVDQHHDDVRPARFGGRWSIVPGLAWRRTRGRQKCGDDNE
jgi:hypothetical protein